MMFATRIRGGVFPIADCFANSLGRMAGDHKLNDLRIPLDFPNIELISNFS